MDEIERAIERVFALYDHFGAEDYIGEPVSQLEHMSQAAELALRAGADDEMVLAAFFHDIGHFCNRSGDRMATFGMARHELLGAQFIREAGFPEKVAALIENHVQAKRYLTFAQPGYYEALSEASRETLAFQGGKMTEAEARKFEQSPWFRESVQLRKWDELAKEPQIPVIDRELLKKMARSVLTRSGHT